MRALIFGAGGQVGRALARAAAPGAEIVALGHGQCDVRRRDQVERAIAQARPAIVFNAAAFTAVDRAEAERALAASVNAMAPGLIATAARAAGARTVHISTDYVFDGTARRPCRPGDPANPQSVYGRTKLAGEGAVGEADPDALTVRTSWVYSAHGSNFVTKMLRLMQERERLQVVEDQVGAPTSAPSLAAALWGLAGAGASGLLHYRDAETMSWHGFALAIQEEARDLGLLQTSIPIDPVPGTAYPAPAPRPAYSVLDASEAWAIVGEPQLSLRQSLRATLEEIGGNG